jgi:hypothetical protein
LALVAACGDDSGRPVGGGGPDADLTAIDADVIQPDALPEFADAAVNAAGPLVTVVSPAEPAAGDLSSDAIVTSDRITVLCKAETNPQTGDRVDASSVTVTATGDGVSVELQAIPTGVPDEFEASLFLTDFANGTLSVSCTASDNTAAALQNSATNNTFLDLGPAVDILTPIVGTSYANQMDVIFTVSADPVTAGDTAADPDISSVALTIAGVTVPGVSNSNGTFTATVIFDAPEFNPSLDDQQTLRVSAANTRASAPVVRVEEVVFNVDNEGPTIIITTPLAGELIAGIIPITATVTDPTGILAQSVVATVAGIHEVSLNSAGGDVYSGFFDTRILGPLIFPNIIIRAQDVTANQSSVGYLVGLDNASPVATLDSPSLREAQVVEGELVCSARFDPLGDDSINDGQGVLQLFDVRARVEDRANNFTGTGVVVPIAYVDTSSVELFLLDDESAALVVDTDGDGICDDINPLLVPTSVPTASGEVAEIDMVVIDSTGTSFNAPDGAVGPTFVATDNGPLPTPSTGHVAAFHDCTAGEETDPPAQVCISTPLTRVIQVPGADLGVIYGIPPAIDLQCMGNGVDALATNLADGWACLAVRGADNLGNSNVSAPLRICIDSDADGGDGCPAEGVINFAGSPNCTGTYNSVTDTVDTGTPCTVDGAFPSNEVRRTDF